ncbi:Probable 28S ribosomal protein S26, mitochondrial [Sergentomyia squamirostris]
MFRALVIGAQECLSLRSWQGLQSVRWRRKPRWLPMAKSRYNKTPVRTPVNPEEKEEMKRLYNVYRTQIRSVRKFLITEVQTKLAQTSVIDLSPEEEEAEMKRCLEINAKWNEEIAKARDERQAKLLEARKEDIMDRLEAKKYREEERIRLAEEKVRVEIERSKTFITRENLEKSIEQALDNPMDYNFALDLQMNLYRGRLTTTPSENLVPEAKEEKIQ